MARPRVFISSTYYDLKHIRSSLEIFIESLGFDSVLFEKGDVAFHPDAALDESCYREASSADIFVLVIGGRYGSAASNSKSPSKDFFESYDSITRKEFEFAQDADVPTFILIDNSVHSEYQTYLKNRENLNVKYAHVDSIGVFKLIESIFERSRNNPVFGFERATQIESWLREQWSGLFRELLRSRSQQKELSTLNSQVASLQSVNETLKTYLEAVLAKVNPADAADLIKGQDAKLTEVRRSIDLSENPFYRFMLNSHSISEDDAYRMFNVPESPLQAVDIFESMVNINSPNRDIGDILRNSRAAQRDYNKGREIIGLPSLDFSLIPGEFSFVADIPRNIKEVSDRKNSKLKTRAREDSSDKLGE